MMKKSNQTKNIWLKSERLFLAAVSDSASMKKVIAKLFLFELRNQLVRR
jgi:hypothetical protein